MTPISLSTPWMVTVLLAAVTMVTGGLLYRDRRQFDQQKESLQELHRKWVASQEEMCQRINHCQESEQKFRRLAENAMDCIWLLDLQTYRFVYVSPSVIHLRGITPEKAIGERLEDAFTPNSVNKLYRLLNETMEKLMASEEETAANGIVCELEQYRRDGTTITTEVSIRMIFEEEGNLLVLGVSRDVSEKRKLQEKLLKEQDELRVQTTIYEALFRSTYDAIAYFDDQERIIDFNNRFAGLFGYSINEVRGRHMNDVVFSPRRKTSAEILPIPLEMIQSNQAEMQTIRYHRDGTPIHVIAKGVPIYIDGRFWGGYAVYSDISEQKMAEKKLQQLATTDALTGLFNRRQFMETAAFELRKSKRYGHPLSLILIDIDHFKNVNDQFGHDVGDMALVLLANKLRQQARASDEIFRLGGEEFGMLLPSTDGEGAMVAAERIRKAVEAEELKQNQQLIHFTISLGVTEYVPEMETVDELFKRADNALYAAKREGRNRTVRE